MKSHIKNIVSKLRYNIIVETFNALYLLRRKKQFAPKVVSIEETINKIVSEKCSVSRFGDGEILLTENHPIGFQKADKMLSKRLTEVFLSNEANHLICISDVFEDINRYNRRARRFWRTHFYLYGYIWEKLIDKKRIYYNTFITRPYMDFASKSKSGEWFLLLQKIWVQRDIVFIEGEKSRLGVGNDLFTNTHSIKRILCPPRNAFDKYNTILSEATKLDKNSLILVALGPTATVLAYDLHKLGYQAIDIGHVDIEYEWCNMKVTHKVKIPNKFVNEQPGGDNVNSVNEETYYNQIISKIE